MRRSTRSCRGRRWHEVLRDRSRNFLFNYLGLGEDKHGDWASAPTAPTFVYFLRAYFAFKMGLPFGYSNCSRGTAGKPPKCYQWFDIEHPEVTRPAPPPEQNAASATRRACSGQPPLQLFSPAASRRASSEPAAPSRSSSGLRRRSANICGPSATSSKPDPCERRRTTTTPIFITVPLTQETLRPGTVYADPYGHVLMLVQARAGV